MYIRCSEDVQDAKYPLIALFFGLTHTNHDNCSINPFMHNVVKWPNILLKFCGVHTARFLKYVWPFYNIMHERVNQSLPTMTLNIITDILTLDETIKQENDKKMTHMQ